MIFTKIKKTLQVQFFYGIINEILNSEILTKYFNRHGKVV